MYTPNQLVAHYINSESVRILDTKGFQQTNRQSRWPSLSELRLGVLQPPAEIPGKHGWIMMDLQLWPKIPVLSTCKILYPYF